MNGNNLVRIIILIAITVFFIPQIGCVKSESEITPPAYLLYQKPYINTNDATNVTMTTADCGGESSWSGYHRTTAKGIYWGTTQVRNENNKTDNGPGDGSFTTTLTGLTPNTLYYFQAYATNASGTAYGAFNSFTTKPKYPSVVTTPVKYYTNMTAKVGGVIVCEGADEVTERGIYWGESPDPETAGIKIPIESDSGSFSTDLKELVPGTTYYIKAYAINSLGTGFGELEDFTTSMVYCLPEFVTNLISDVTTSTANSGGIINSDAGEEITSCGVCWSTIQNPTISDNITNDNPVTGIYNSSITGLMANTTYYVRAYASSSLGTAYGDELVFTTRTGTISDIEGNSYYTQTIGSQIWMAENLKTTKFNDGASIPLVTDNTAWSNLTTPGYCFYNNTEIFKITYGALYNWYTVNTGRLCPTGWHVPSNEEWTTLENYLITNGYNYDGTTTGNKIAKSMASNTLWTLDSGEGAVGNTDYPAKRNATGFTGLPSGRRYLDGQFINNLVRESWWSSTECDNNTVWARWIWWANVDFLTETYLKNSGFSVRCIKDE